MPAWPCPICLTGHAEMDAKSLRYEKTAPSRAQHNEDAWDPEWTEYVFTCWGECSNRWCKQRFAIAGAGGVQLYYDDDGEQEVSRHFTPLYCNPMPRIIDLPRGCPDEVQNELEAAFQLFWSNRKASANRIRAAIEALLDYLRVQRRQKAKTGKFRDLTLHERLEILSRRDKIAGGHLMALKWLGNSGSHNRDVTREDLFDAFELFEHALEELIERRSTRAAGIAK